MVMMNGELTGKGANVFQIAVESHVERRFWLWLMERFEVSRWKVGVRL